MQSFRTLSTLAATAAALALAAPASGDAPDVFGPFEYDVAYTFSNCGFPADVSLHGTFTNRGFANPERNINVVREEGTVVNPATGTTLLVKNAWTELVRPPQSPDEGLGTFVERGARTHILVPGGGTVLLDAGYLHYRFPDGLVFVAHGRHDLEVEGDVAGLCAALAS
ncbi:MAG TPA: hypothetical protein VLB86_03055 [Gaiellaceae bacterium]|nr:hypothetical protein [Gaiellaceae bacterium]